jgi:hypothetical protein
MAMRDITELMNSYRKCSRNLWNVYFSKRKDIGDALDVFEQIRELLFDSVVLSELSYEGESEGREALLEVSGAKVFHDESAEKP